MSHVFISHSSQDFDALLVLHEALRAAGIPDWYSPPEVSDRAAVNAAIDDAFAMIILVSAASVRSGQVMEDVKRARDRGLTLIPYQIDKARLNGFFKREVLPHLRLSSDMANGLEQLTDEVQRAYKKKCPVIAVMNLKGGVGKTTVTSQVFGAWQATLGGRILLVDLDPQYNLTQVFFEMEAADASATVDRAVISLFERSSLHVRNAPSPAENWKKLNTEPFAPASRDRLVHPLMTEDGPPGRLDLITGQFEISKYAFATDMDALAVVKQHFLRSIDHYRSEYDLIVFDTNPNATFLTRCVLEAADRVLAPIHANIYSLRGVQLLNQLMKEQMAGLPCPEMSVLFNAVSRSEQSTFEGDAYSGAFDETAGFALSTALMKAAVPRSGHLSVRAPEEGEPAWKQLVIHSGRGGGLKDIRKSLTAVALELQNLIMA